MAFSHAEWLDLAPLFALDVLSGTEKSAFQAHMASCDECAAEVRSLQPVVEALGGSATPVDPSAEVRQRVLARLHTPALKVSGSGLWLALAATLLLAMGLGAYSVNMHARVAALEANLREVAQRVESANRQDADVRALAEDARIQADVLAALDLTRVDLAGQEAAPTASGHAFWSRSRGLVVAGMNLPALPPGRTYQFWIVTVEAPVSVGFLNPDSSGRVSSVLRPPGAVGKAVAMAVTIEPAGGVPLPTGAKYLLGPAN